MFDIAEMRNIFYQKFEFIVIGKIWCIYGKSWFNVKLMNMSLN